MGYDVSLGKINGLERGVTYNHYPILKRLFGPDSVRILHGKTGRESIPLLAAAVAELRGQPVEDPFALTEGNVKAVLEELLVMAKKRPTRKWYVC